MAKLLRTNGTGSAQTTAETQNEKEKVYADLATAEADIANIAENEFIDTLDEEVVKEDEIATKDWAIGYPDYARGQLNSSAITTYTASEDCIITFNVVWYRDSTSSSLSKIANTIISVNNVTVASVDNTSVGSVRIFTLTCTIFLKKGDVLESKRSDSSTDVMSFPADELRVWGIKA